ncbi:MAG: bis(5'-nucleosyl)-tetraphosphatase (symmetrical) YqeK [Lachnospiraceae bacterium]|nr:bis(5'-nucleosyl)-tetraphosphatase (symmetrical) YqeK [Lachnospiraceae bacterium]
MKKAKIVEKIRSVQSEKRFEHTMGVSYIACALAMRYDEDPEKAYLAGLLHDSAKHLKDEKLLAIAEKYHLPVSESERREPYLLHGKVGALIAKKTFGIEDKDILNAITYHTTGRPGMSKLEKIIFIADYIEPNRDKAENLPKIRKMAFEDLDLTLLKISEDTLSYLRSRKDRIDPMTEKTYEYYLKECVFNGGND